MERLIFTVLSTLTFLYSAGMNVQSDSTITTNPEKLDEVVVTGSNQYQEVDKLTVFPDKEMIKHSTSSLSLLNNLMLPGLSIDIVTQSANIYGKGVIYRVNGIPANLNKVQSINPSDILKIEYSNTPSMREATENAGGVINIILKPIESGISLYDNLFTAVTTGMINENLSARYNKKASEFALNYNMQWRDYNESYTDSKISYLATTPHMERTLKGEWGDMKMCLNNISADYIYTPNKTTVFATSVAYYFGPWETERFGYEKHYNGSYTNRYQNTRTISQPFSIVSLDMYLKKALKNGSVLEINNVTTYNHSSNKWGQEYFDLNYWGSRNNDTSDPRIAVYQNDARNDKWSNILEASWMKVVDKVILKLGIKEAYAHSETDYTSTTTAPYYDKLNSNQFFFYGEIQGKQGIFGYTVGSGLYHSYVSGNKRKDYSYLRNYSVGRWMLTPSKKIRFNGTIKLSPQFAQISAVNDTYLVSDDLTASQGNPRLKPASSLETDVYATYSENGISAYLRAYYGHTWDPIYSTVRYEAPYYVFQSLNGKAFDSWSVGINLQYQKKLSSELTIGAAIYGAFMRQESRINKDTKYSLNSAYFSFKALANWRNWSFNASATTPTRSLYGEIKSKIAPSSQISLGYTWKNFNFAALISWIACSKGGYKTYTSLSSINPSIITNLLRDNANTVGVGITYRFSKGKQNAKIQRTLQNSDREKGALLLQ